MRRVVAFVGLVGVTLSGCSPGPLVDRVPEAMGGLPAGAPARPTTPYQYPAVHDMPPARSAAPLSEDAQVKLEKDLAAARDRQSVTTRDQPPAPPGKKPAATQRQGAKTGVDGGAKPNP